MKTAHALLSVLSALLFAACDSGEPVTPDAGAAGPEGAPGFAALPPDTAAELRFVHTYTEAAAREATEAVIKDYRAAHPGAKVRAIGYNPDEYHKLIAKSLKVGGDVPGAYFQWCGAKPAEDLYQGLALDLTEIFRERGWERRFLPAALRAAQSRGRYVVVPTSIDVSVLIWYNRKLFAEHQLTPPATWAEFEALCAALKEKGVTPLAQGNSGGWPMANWAALICAQVAGEEWYDRVFALAKGTRFQNPAFVRALGLLGDCAAAGFFNSDLAAEDETVGMTYFTSGKAAMHPIGSWFVQEVSDPSYKDFDYDFFASPLPPDGAGDGANFLGVCTGFSIGRQSGQMRAAVEFLDHFTRPEVQARYTRIGNLPAVRGAVPDDVAPAVARMQQFLETRTRMVAPPDTGYRESVATAFFDGVKAVLAGTKPEEALAGVDRAVEKLRE